MEKSKYMEVIKNKNKVEGLWDCVENNNHGEEVAAGIYPWPPRSYTCSFCKRQFRSAQALGGHMNIHRRDRARLRQYSPPPPSDHQGQNGQFSFLNLNLEPNPNNNLNFNTNPSNISSSSSSSPKWGPPPPTTTAATFTSKLPPLFASSTLSSTLPATSISEMRTWGKKGISQISDPVHKDPDFGKIRATKRLNLELEDQFTFRKDTNVMKRAEFVRLELEIGLLGEEDEDLDLELRLGYA